MKKILCAILLSLTIQTTQTIDNGEKKGWLIRLYSFFSEESQMNQNNGTQEAPTNQAETVEMNENEEVVQQATTNQAEPEEMDEGIGEEIA